MLGGINNTLGRPAESGGFLLSTFVFDQSRIAVPFNVLKPHWPITENESHFYLSRNVSSLHATIFAGCIACNCCKCLHLCIHPPSCICLHALTHPNIFFLHHPSCLGSCQLPSLFPSSHSLSQVYGMVGSCICHYSSSSLSLCCSSKFYGTA